MANAIIHQSGRKITISFEPGKSLLDIIRQNGFRIDTSCGGNGICGKCRVRLKDAGSVTACLHHPEKNIEVYLPGVRESHILTLQYKYSEQVPLLPGNTSMTPGLPFGVAIDIGTTTVVLYLVNLNTGSTIQTKGIVNPQTKYGADVISRILYCSQEDNGLETLSGELIKALNRELKMLSEQAGILNDQIVKIVVTGNTTMLHIFLGIDPSSIAVAPFTPVFTEGKALPVPETGIMANPEGRLLTVPSVSGYVGADIVAGIASLHPPDKIKNFLYLDIGTNGEIALVTPEQVLCCATAAGPAFEGAAISCGMGAFGGAISAFSDKNHYTTIADEPPAGICGSGLIDMVAYLVREEIVSSDGMLDETFRIPTLHGDFPEISLTQQDIREVQLAKAAIMAGIRVIMKMAGKTFDDIDALFLAGGFGNYINTDSAVEIGLLPEALRERTISIGNASGTGAILLLKNEEFLGKIESLLSRTTYVELSGNDDFVTEYAMNMNFS
ncbi:MAG: ASKHA domain-containing protein [Bacteroidales bacterium]|nr:ASKHA domain-containing protein [Bacteroidales bacterium]